MGKQGSAVVAAVSDAEVVRARQKAVAARRINQVGRGYLGHPVIAIEFETPATGRTLAPGDGIFFLEYDAGILGIAKQDFIEVRASYLIGKRQHRR